MGAGHDRRSRLPLKAVILDWAGTAVDYGSFAPAAVFVRLFDSRGVAITDKQARSGMGLMKKDHLRAILRLEPVAEAWRARHGATPSEDEVEGLFRSFSSMQLEVLTDYAEPIPGLQSAVGDLRRRGLRIGSTTGYTRPMMDILAPEASRRGYTPDCIVCPDEVPAGRPAPWMCFQNMMRLGTYPAWAIVKVGDTPHDIEEGVNAGMWSVGLSLTGNLLGLQEQEVAALTDADRRRARADAESVLYAAGAHTVVDGIWDLPLVLDDLEARLSRGETP